jgi:hypothetical protein
MTWYDDELAALKAERAHLLSTLAPPAAPPRAPAARVRPGRRQRQWWRTLRVGRRQAHEEENHRHD